LVNAKRTRVRYNGVTVRARPEYVFEGDKKAGFFHKTELLIVRGEIYRESIMATSRNIGDLRSTGQPGPLQAASGPPSPPRVLIADDNVQGVELLEAYLSGTDYLLETAADGEETLQKVKRWHPDLILLDIMMPKISGFEVCKRLRADRETHDIGVLMITALDQPSDIERAVEAGTDDFLTKPINKTELLLRVRSVLKSRLNKRDLDRALAYIEGVERGTSD
jgi:two-component system, OmpR family, alkaline phosphatase synthesis response regulator PhoP